MSLSASIERVLVVTHVHHLPQGGGQQQPVGSRRFGLGQPLVLGTIQIMIGLMVLLLGISMAIVAESVGVYSGIFVWGALIYIIAGSLTIAAGQSFNRCLVNGSLGVGVVAAIVSIAAVIIHSMDAWLVMSYCPDYGTGVYGCYQYLGLMRSFSIVLIIFHFLMLVVSITIAGYACNATCKCNSEMERSIKSAEEPSRLTELPAGHGRHPALSP